MRRTLAAMIVVGAGQAAGCRTKALSAPAKAQVETVGAATLPGGATKTMVFELGSGVKMELVLIPAGSFLMGSPEGEPGRLADEGPQHRVTIAKPFYLGKTEVTQAQWQVVMGADPSYYKGDDLPVEMVSWYDSQQFCKKLSATLGKTIRLPSEAEWEYACRAGSATRFWFGYSDEDLGEYAWYKQNSKYETHPVGQKKPNAWGLYDMLGNIEEWCEDWYHDTYDGAPEDGKAWLEKGPKNFRVARNGSWLNHAGLCRSACRLWFAPGFRFKDVGFRVALGTE